MSKTSFNLPLFSIPAYYLLAVYAHAHAALIATKGNLKHHDNRNPHSSTNTENLKRRLTAREFTAYERAERCHKNHLENMPLFCVVVLGGILAEQKVGEDELGLIEFVVGWMVLRVLYTVNYLMTETLEWSYLRSALYFTGTLWAFVIIGRAAFALG